jgi:hypothetical protein
MATEQEVPVLRPVDHGQLSVPASDLREVLDHNPTEKDLLRFFRRFQEILTSRGLTLNGITTDGLPLYPKPPAAVSLRRSHQYCKYQRVQV